MSRAAILPYPGDPFLLNFWLHFFDNVWHDEVDKLYIYLNTPAEAGVVDYIRKLCLERPKISFIYENTRTDHGIGIDRTIDLVEQDLVMLIEDDGFIFRKGYVENSFKAIESGDFDVVGSKRGSCHPEISIKAKEIWGLDYEGYGDQGCNFWPNFFFTKKEILLKTDRNFRGKAWYKGEKIEALNNYEVQAAVINGDTFVNTSLQIRAIIPQARIFTQPQYHANTYDLEDASENKNLFDGRAPWVHVGSLSSGVSGVIRDQHNRALDRRLIDPPGAKTSLPYEWCTTEPERREWERRVTWWEMFVDHFETQSEKALNITPDITNYASLYRLGLFHVKSQFVLSPTRINKSKMIYKRLLGI